MSLKLYCKEKGYKQKVLPLTDERVNLFLYFAPLEKNFFLLKALTLFSTIIKILQEEKKPYSVVWSFSKKEDLEMVKDFIKEYKISLEVKNSQIKQRKDHLFVVENIQLDIKKEVFSLIPEIKEFNKFLILTTKYNKKTDLSAEAMQGYIKNFRKIYKSILISNKVKCSKKEAEDSSPPQSLIDLKEEFLTHAKNDLNLFGATQALFKEIKYLNKAVKGKKTLEIKKYCYHFSSLMQELGESVGLFNISPKLALKEMNAFLLKNKYGKAEYEEVKKLIIQRHQARMDKDFKLADELYKKLQEYNIELHDYSKFTYWESQL